MVVCLSGSDAESSVILVCRCSFNLVLARLKQLNRVSTVSYTHLTLPTNREV